MPFEDVYRVSDRLTLVPVEEIDALEKRLGFPLPLGYREYLTTLGLGNCCEGLEVLSPAEVEMGLTYWQKEHAPIASEEGFWEDGSLLTAKELAKSVIFARNCHGDHFIGCPRKKRAVFELPRHDSKMRLLEQGFLAPFDCWYHARKRFSFPFFVPENDGHRRSSGTLHLKVDANPLEAWPLIEKTWSGSLRVVEGDTTAVVRTCVFIKAIQGSATLWVVDGQNEHEFYFGYDVDHEREVKVVIQQLSHLFES